MGVLAPLFALIAPFIVWPIEFLLPYPYVVEEIVKGFLVYLLLDVKETSTKIKTAIAVGVLFSFSETVLYLFNFFAVGYLPFFFKRLLYTVPLHVITVLVILFPALKDKRLIVVGVILSGVLHFLYNKFIAY